MLFVVGYFNIAYAYSKYSIIFKSMKVTIITACYNREQTIRGCIESVLAQDYPDIEYIVVDGASTDGSLSVIRSIKNE